MADKTLKSLNFGGADNYFPLPIVSTNDNDNILVVANGEWTAKSPNDLTGQYVWSKHDSVDGPVTGYVISNDGNKYPDGGSVDGVYYKLVRPILPYLSFLGNEDFTLKTNNTAKNWDGMLEYSTDTTTWNTWNGTEISSSGSKLYLRGTGNTRITGNSSDCKFVFAGTNTLKIACKGNIENLLDYETVSTGAHPTMAQGCYGSMFRGCTSLTTAPSLPATTLADSCYRFMFNGCTSLTTAPELLATTLVSFCYNSMFSGCTSLTTAPELPATTLADYCYYGMFNGCTSLTTAPELPATTLAIYCYQDMFRGCTSLTTAPSLPATTIAEYCYNSMFEGCTALTTVPELPATTLANSCYQDMFKGCTSFTTVPSLPATTIAEYCYNSMFQGCTSLTTPPSVLPATTLANSCYDSMFYGCTSLTTAPALPATTLAGYCYQRMFYGCTSLTTPPSVLPATTLATSCYMFMFEFTAINAIPKIMATTYDKDSCKGMFDDIKTLNVYSTSGNDHTYGWTAPSSASTYCSGMFGSDDKQSEWAKLDGSNFPNSGTPTDGKTYYFKTVV